MKLTKNQRQLLEELINKYERKKGYGKEDINNRGTIIDVKKFFKNYMHISNSQFKNEINTEMIELEGNNLIQLKWEKYNKGEYLEKIYLNEEMIPEIYEILDKVPRIIRFEQTKEFFQRFRKNTVPDLIPLVNVIISKLEKLETPISIVDLEDIQLTKDYFYGLNELLRDKEKEISKRHWSIQLYNDSKRWEALEGKIINVIKKEIYPQYDGLESGTILGEFGVIENPKAIDIFGNCIMSKNGKKIDFSIDVNGVGMYPSFFRNCEIDSLEVDRVVTIENKTSYHDYLIHLQNNKKNELVIYLGGYHNHIRTVILQKLNEFIKRNNLTIPFLHWGDIDLGGLSILINLRNKTGIPFQPLFMDVETFTTNIQSGKEIKDRSYLKKLQELLNNESFREFNSLINEIIQAKVRLEQECIIL